MLSPPLAATDRGESFISLLVQPWFAATEHRDVRLRYAAYLSPFSSTRLQVPRSRLLELSDVCFPLSAARNMTPTRLRNLDTEQLFSYCYELQTQHRLESVATRTPPPICASALGSLTALVWRAWGAASDLRNTRWAFSDNPLNRRTRRVFGGVAQLQARGPKASF